MDNSLRMPFFIVALILVLVIILIEVGSLVWIRVPASEELAAAPGIGISYLGLVDGVLLYTIAYWGLAAGKLIPAPIFGMTGGIASFIVMLLLFIVSIVLIIAAFLFLTMLVTLLLSGPFGTIAYFAAFADFAVGPARVTLGILMLLKFALAIFLVLAQQTFLANKTFVILIATSLLANVIVSFLHGMMPTFLVSILDAVAAIVVGVLGAIWALIKCIGSIESAFKGIKSLLSLRSIRHA